MNITLGESGWARPYQAKLIEFFRDGGRQAFEVWHRKAGKDRVACFIEAALAMRRPGLYWHALPSYEDARKVIWDAIMMDGRRLLDWAFPAGIVAKRLDHDMKIELINGSIWQPVGADNYDSLVGAFPRHITWSEYAQMHPNARSYLRPALALGEGTELFITTPRGYNHAHTLWETAKSSSEWHTSLLTVDDTKAIPLKMIEDERRDMPDELFRQEYYCDFSAANVGSILGRYLEAAEREGRIHDDVETVADGPGVEVSSDIGFRDTAAWWFWQPRAGGFALVDYDEASGLDAADWAERLKERSISLGHNLRRIWLPHDARARTWQSKHTGVETFVHAFGAERIKVVPALKSHDKINAARLVIQKCEFHKTRCKTGLAGLRAWCFDFNDETHAYSREPRHDWASHPGDAFAYGASVMRQYVKPEVPKMPVPKPVYELTLDEAWAIHERNTASERRI